MNPIAAVFPGQGSQSVGMGKELFDNFSVFKHTLEEASDALGQNMKALLFEGPTEELQLTQNTQPALVTCSTGAFRVLKSEFDFNPQFVAGHSVGEYAALVAAEALSFSDAVKAVRLRGKAMQSAVPVGQGAMAALLGPSDEQATALAKWAEEQNPNWVLEAANFNSPGQVVLSGSSEALTWLKDNIKNYSFDPAPKKVRLIPLKVSAPFHCRLMKPAQETMKTHLESTNFNEASVKVCQNVDAKIHTDPSTLKTNLISQVSGSVLWTKSVNELKNQSVQTYIEVGSGVTLSGLIKKIDSSDVKLFNTQSLDDLKLCGEFLETLNGGMEHAQP